MAIEIDSIAKVDFKLKLNQILLLIYGFNAVFIPIFV